MGHPNTKKPDTSFTKCDGKNVNSYCQALMQAKNCLKKGLVLLDVEANHVVKEWIARGLATIASSDDIIHALMAPKQHLGAVPGENYFEKQQKHLRLVRDSSGGARYTETGDGVDDDEEDLPQHSQPIREIIKDSTVQFQRLTTHKEMQNILEEA
ncbi:hypothetical protein KIN20_024206 [Parelaphostrongylus tenuis]|uniref:Uncharacterized protein n=1 Tax=Parelaphostrongylus tenuis TaxID=148309 RepID=A0AAD5MWP9_PARTN|nr:hypothetical protein KIN20_024206 [Parelaphostrongylus tenuis]